MIEEFANKLSILVLKKGINLKKGQCLNIVVGPKSYEYAQVMAKKAYEFGARYVNISINDARLTGARSIYQNEKEDLEFVPSFLKNADYEFIAENWARIRIDSGEDRIDDFESNMEKSQTITKAIRKSGKEYSEKTMSNELSWNVCAVPGPMWAKKIMGENATEEDLAKVMSRILRLDNDDYLGAWDDFDKTSKKRSSWLNGLKIKSLHYKSPVTDFKIGFRKNARFCGGSGMLKDGSEFFANLPTEEIFTTPDFRTASGYITTTRPVRVLDHETRDVTLFFEKGEVVDVKAKQGLDIMKKYLAIDDGAKRIGEVALVDESSPIAQSGLVFGSILIDENASCHIALGAGYTECFDVDKPLVTDEDKINAGCNVSLVHTDFMVGGKDLDIIATTYDGKEIKILDKGHFTLK